MAATAAPVTMEKTLCRGDIVAMKGPTLSGYAIGGFANNLLNGTYTQDGACKNCTAGKFLDRSGAKDDACNTSPSSCDARF